MIQEGPFVRCLDAALASFHVERQAYHGGSFIGNHVHRCLKVPTCRLMHACVPNGNYQNASYYLLTHIQPANIHTLCSAPLNLATRSCPDLVPGVQAIGDKFERALLLFSRCHNLYNRADYVSTGELRTGYNNGVNCTCSGVNHTSWLRPVERAALRNLNYVTRNALYRSHRAIEEPTLLP